MNPIKIIQKYYDKNSESYQILLKHSEKVAEKALEIAKNLQDKSLDLDFICEASMLHDIGIYLTDAPLIGCYGREPYIKHGVFGREILEKENLPRHARVCENHIGVGLTKEDIIRQKLPLPERDMLAETMEEKIISLADLFFSKSSRNKEAKISDIKKEYSKFGPEAEKRLEDLLSLL